MKKAKDELWAQIFKLWPAAMKYEDLPLFYSDTSIPESNRSRLLWKKS